MQTCLQEDFWPLDPNIIEFDKREQDMKSAAELEKNLITEKISDFKAWIFII